MNNKVVNLVPCLDPDVVLEQAKGEFQKVIVIGNNYEGELDVRSTTSVTVGDALLLIEQFKAKLVNGDYSE